MLPSLWSDWVEADPLTTRSPSEWTGWVTATVWTDVTPAPSEWTGWVAATTWTSEVRTPSEWTGWVAATTWTDATLAPSEWSDWVEATTAVPAQGHRRTPDAWVPLGPRARLTASGWVLLDAPTPDPEPTPERPFFGAIISTPETEAHWLQIEAAIGHRMGIRRSYSGGMVSGTIPARVREDITAGRASWHSFKGDWALTAAGEFDAAITAHLNALPSDHDYMLTFAHEPENDNPIAQEVPRSAEWRAAQAHVYDLVKAVRPQTWFGPVLMGYTLSPASGRVWQRWVPPVGKMDFFGLDPYNPYRYPAAGNGTEWRDWPLDGTNFLKFQGVCDERGVPGAIGETASNEHETQGPMRKANWIRDGARWAIDHQYLAFCYFSADKANDTAPGMLIDSSPESLTAWGEVIAANQRGVKTP